MKIWVIGRNYPAIKNRMGGSFEIEQAKMLARGGHDVTYIAVVFHPYKKIRNWGFASWNENGIRVCGFSCPFFPEKMNIEMSKFRALVLKRALNRVEKETGLPDIIHVHYPTMITEPEVVLDYQKQSCAVVCTEHWSLVQKQEINAKQKKKLKEYVDKSNAFICVGEPLKESVKQLTNTHREIFVIPNVVENLFHPKIQCIRDEFIFIMVGRLMPVKRIDLVLEAFFRLYTNNKKTKMLLVGEGEAHQELNLIIEKFGLENVVTITGTLPREKVAETLSDADCLICYSELETFGVPIIEAWASGVPVIASNTVGVRTFWDERLGYLIEGGNPTLLASAMEKMLENRALFDKEFLHQYAIEHFSENVVRKKLENIYFECN